jgi:AsmA protein
MRKALKIGGIAVAAIVVLLLIVPLFINADSFRPQVQSRLSDALGRQVTIGKLGFSLFSGSVNADDLSIADDPKFSSKPFVTAKSIGIGVEVLPLIFSKKLNVTSLVLKEPQIELLQTPSGVWNFSSLGGAAKTQQSPNAKPGEPMSFSVGSLKIKDGRLDLGHVGEKPQSLTNVNLDAKNVSYRSAFPFKLTADTANDGKIKIDGKAGPVNATDSAQTPFDATVSASKIDLADYLGADSGLAGLLDYDGKVNSNGQNVVSQGVATAKNLVLVKGGAPSTQPIAFDYATDLSLKSQTGALTKGALKLGKSVANLVGTYDAHGKVPALNMRFNAPGIPVNDIVALLPSLGVALPKGASLQGGTMESALNISGPLARLVIDGPVKMLDTRLTGFNMGSQMAAIAALGGLNTGSDTHILHLNSAVKLTPEGIRLDNIDGAVQGIGTIAGSGTVSASKELDFHLVATPQQGSAVTSLIPIKGMSGGIPFMIKGTASSPQFVPDMGRTAQSAVQGLLHQQSGSGDNNPIESLTGLFGGKKKK